MPSKVKWRHFAFMEQNVVYPRVNQLPVPPAPENPSHPLLGDIVEYEYVSDKDSEDSEEEDIAVAARKEWQAARKANPLSYLDDFWDDFEDKIG